MINAFSAQNSISNEIYRAKFIKCVKFYISVSIIICLYAFTFLWRRKGAGYVPKCIYLLYKLYTHMYSRVENTNITINTSHVSNPVWVFHIRLHLIGACEFVFKFNHYNIIL